MKGASLKLAIWSFFFIAVVCADRLLPGVGDDGGRVEDDADHIADADGVDAADDDGHLGVVRANRFLHNSRNPA